MSEKKQVRVQIDKELADKTEKVLNTVGISTTTAVNIFYRKVASTGKIPFDIDSKKRK
ncbi:type II toxin-antitoxin system RelB/DinJ family antitoxin [Pediococcus pentosaceus]|uniref:type II toxin-antitoxin system RelB/DinJ family antitoxin n=1 Tax=Pediococcus pentosaceus TaxID=1255 RepID=UPI00140516F8|nr:type II toxin-antitoxin system RelB/DinJ family antitoxin [Pediococcus pentosaceus]